MSTLAITTGDLGLLSPRFEAASGGGPILSQVLARTFAALIILTALVSPDCCLSGRHAHGADLDGLGSVCFKRAV